jgi:EF hand
MFKTWTIAGAGIAATLVAGTLAVNAGTAQSEKATGVVSPGPAAEKAEHERKLAAATEAAKQRLLVMDTENSGRVSKQEWMRFMEAEFDRLDANHNGELDVKELTQSRVRYRAWVGK